MNLAALELLASAPAEEAADAAARVLGISPGPAEIVARLAGARTEELTELAAEWRRVAHKLEDHTGQLGDAAQRAFGGWRGEAADAAAGYVADLVTALGAQRDATVELAEVLERLGAELGRAQRDAAGASLQVGVAVTTAGCVAMGAVVILAGTPGAQGGIPAVVVAYGEFLAVLVGALVAHLVATDRRAGELEGTAGRTLDALTGLHGAERLPAVRTPLAPDLVDVSAAFDQRAFYSAHMPEDLREVSRDG
ncbi:MAG TPA: hypothetical protein VGP02_13890 [Mycobacteriales bacterium]|jgi:hypothetical protein|nr:hypothetical protein [Mycobacteriales bacterium]